MEDRKQIFFRVIEDRRSIRKYKERKVSEEELRTILESGRLAPSGENSQPWRFIVVRDQKSKEFLSDIGKKASGRRFTGEFLSKQMQARFAGLEDQEKMNSSLSPELLPIDVEGHSCGLTMAKIATSDVVEGNV